MTAVDDLAALIRRRRELQRWTQAELARLCGASEESIRGYEAGRSVPPVATMKRIVGALGLCWDDISELHEDAQAEKRRRVRKPQHNDWDGAACQIWRVLVPGRGSVSEAVRGAMFCTVCPEALAEPLLPDNADGSPRLPECCQEPFTPERQAAFDAWLAKKLAERGERALPPERAEKWWLLDEAVGEGRALG